MNAFECGRCSGEKDYQTIDRLCKENEQLKQEVLEWKQRVFGGMCRMLSDPNCTCSLCIRDGEIEMSVVLPIHIGGET